MSARLESLRALEEASGRSVGGSELIVEVGDDFEVVGERVLGTATDAVGVCAVSDGHDAERAAL